MTDSIFTTYMLIFFILIFGIIGLILLIVGLIQSKRGLWIAGICSLLLSASGIFFSINHAINKYRDRSVRVEYPDYSEPFETDPYYDLDSLETIEYFPDSVYSNVITGYIKNKKSDLILMKLLIDREVEYSGINVMKLTQPSSRVEKEFYKMISLYLSFSDNFQGLLELKSFDRDFDELSSNIIEVSQIEGNDIYVDFSIEKIRLKEIDYITLSLASQKEF